MLSCHCEIITFITKRKIEARGFQYLASSVRATIPAANGADAEVPV